MSTTITEYYSVFCAIVSGMIIWRVAPVEAPNKPMSPSKRERYQAISLAVGSCFIVLVFVAFQVRIVPVGLAAFLFSGELAAAISLVAGAI